MPTIDTAMLGALTRFLDVNAFRHTLITSNLANIDTPGYSRQRPVFLESDPVVVGRLTFGTGADLQKIESVRDSVLELRIDVETQREGMLDAVVSGMQQVEPMFSGGSGNIADQLTKFFNSLDQLSTNASSIPLRQGVLTAAGNLATAFRTISTNLQQQRSNVDLNIGQTVLQVNTLTTQIAKLNSQIRALENIHQEASVFIDQRGELIRQLSGLVDVSVITTESGISLTTGAGTALVAGARSFDLQTQLQPSGEQHIVAQGSDITASLSGGRLGGLLQVRDQLLPGVAADLDTLAAGLASALNTAHRAGFDLNGTAGTDLFAPVSGQGAASVFAVNISNPALVAASSDGSAGSNGNLQTLSAVRTQAVSGGQNPVDFYANLVFKIGNDVANSAAEQNASNQILQQLQNQRSSVSGVSLDEEAANLIRYQRAFEAAARVVTTVNEMLDAATNLGRY